MARQDINMNATLGEVETTDNLTRKVISVFRLLPSQPRGDNETHLYAEIELLPSLAIRCNDGFEIYTKIPYVADERQLQVRIRIDNGSGMPEYLLNPDTNHPWFNVMRYEKEILKTVRMAEVWRSNNRGHFNLVLKGGSLI